MTSGTRIHHLLLTACVGVIAAANAGRVDENGTGAVWVAPELLASLESTPVSPCMHDIVIEQVEMLADGRVTFEWHPATGELSIAGVAPTPPAASASEPSHLAMQSCESR